MQDLALLIKKDTGEPALLAVFPRPSRKQQSRWRCHILAPPIREGGRPVELADIRLEMN